MKRVVVLFSVLILLQNCSPDCQVIDLLAPSGKNSEEPSFFILSNGEVGMSWLEKSDKEITLRFSTLEEGKWSSPRTIFFGDKLLTNWADFPGIITKDDYWLAWFLQLSNPETFAYDVMITQSSDAGNSWTEPVKLHADSVEAEHGFVSVVQTKGGFQLIWLDGRNAGGEHGAGSMNLRTAKVAYNGIILDRMLLDDRTCDCCQTALSNLPNGKFVAIYRDRSEEEVRDMSVVEFDATSVSEPQNVFRDNWHIEGCPVNGPRIISNGNRFITAWFTMGDNEVAKVQMAFSQDGTDFSNPVLIDSVNLGRIDLLERNGAFYVSYLDKEADKSIIKIAEIKNKQVVNTFSIVEVPSSRKTGFPRMANVSDGILVAYTNADEGKVELRKLRLE